VYVVEKTGGAPVIVFIHGYCQSSAYWMPTAALAAEAGARCLVPDLPGFGRSADAPGPYTMEAYADWLAALLTERGIAKATVVGGSMGGVVAQHFALRHPALLERLLLVGTGAFTADPPAALAKADSIAAAEWDAEVVEPIARGFFFNQPAEADFAEHRAIALLASKAAAVEAARSNGLSRTFERLGEITVPVLIVQGRHDRARTPEHGALMCERLQDARLTVIEDAGHTPQLEQPAAFHAAALPFLFGREPAADGTDNKMPEKVLAK
jgi:pimeloyl-ACP methyl ester carboxylesterase